MTSTSSPATTNDTLNGVSGPFVDVTLVDADVSIVPPSTQESFPYHLDKVAADSQLSVSLTGTATGAHAEGAGACSGPGMTLTVGGSNVKDQGCGRLEPGDATLVIKVSSGAASGHVKFTAKKQA